MYINLSGLPILITGATHELGQTIARKLGEAGATLILQYAKKAPQAEELVHILSGNSCCFQANFLNKKELVQFVDQLFIEAPDTEVFINNASFTLPSPTSLSDEKWFEYWRNIFALNLEAPAFIAKRFIEHWKKRKMQGRIINVSLPLSVDEHIAEHLIYSTAKSAFRNFTQTLSQITFEKNIRTFTVVPPPLRSSDHLYFAKDSGKVSAHLPKARDIAPLITFLCSGMADHATGTVIDMSQAHQLSVPARNSQEL